jgi:hypothetical protein
MGVSTSEASEGRVLPDVALSVLGKAGYDVIRTPPYHRLLLRVMKEPS